VTFLPAATRPLSDLAGLLTAGYEGYPVPMHVDEATLRLIAELWDIDLRRSLVAPNEGIALLGVRGDRGWVGGLGVVPASRGRGLGRRLMEALLEDAPPTVQLEVIEGNQPAVGLYERLGFTHARMLEVWSLRAPVAPADANEVPARPVGGADLPWQRQDESLPPEYRRLETDGGAIAIALRDGRVSVLQLRADDAGAARTLIAAARAHGESLHYVNVDEGDPASSALADLGGVLELRQHELELTR
jgi:GNAT superfamily N-acetyltransferase